VQSLTCIRHNNLNRGRISDGICDCSLIAFVTLSRLEVTRNDQVRKVRDV